MSDASPNLTPDEQSVLKALYMWEYDEPESDYEGMVLFKACHPHEESRRYLVGIGGFYGHGGSPIPHLLVLATLPESFDDERFLKTLATLERLDCVAVVDSSIRRQCPRADRRRGYCRQCAYWGRDHLDYEFGFGGIWRLDDGRRIVLGGRLEKDSYDVTDERGQVAPHTTHTCYPFAAVDMRVDAVSSHRVYDLLEVKLSDKGFDKARDLYLAEHNGARGSERQPPAVGDGAMARRAGSVEEDEPGQEPALTKPERLTLCTLASFDPSELASAKQIADAMDLKERLSARTITPAIRKLVDLDLAERPEGERLGGRLTLRGRRLASKIAD